MAKIVILKLSPELLKSVDTRKPESKAVSAGGALNGGRARKARGGSTEPASSPVPSAIPALSLAPGSSPAPGSGSGSGSGPGPIGGGGAKSMAAVNASLRQLDKTGTPCRRWTKASIVIKSFTGVQYTLETWKGAEESPLMELEMTKDIAREKDKEKERDKDKKSNLGADNGSATPNPNDILLTMPPRSEEPGSSNTPLDVTPDLGPVTGPGEDHSEDPSEDPAVEPGMTDEGIKEEPL